MPCPESRPMPAPESRRSSVCAHARVLALALASVLSFTGASPRGLEAATSRDALEAFARPTRAHSSAPLWVWNERMTEDLIRSTLRDLASQKVFQVFVHPRPGLMTPYLSSEWFRLWKLALDEAAKLDMLVWIYDENSYPSGFAGGLVPEEMPESRGLGLHFREAAELPPADAGESIIAVYASKGEGFELLPAGAAGTPPGEKFLVAERREAPRAAWHGGRSYVDLLRPGVTEKFLDITLGAYERELAAELGKRVPGVFMDEPHIQPAGGLPWTPDLPQVFEKRWGYPLLPELPALARPVGDWKRVRHDYYQTLLDLFVTRWAKPYFDRAKKSGLEITGHYWEHEWPRTILVPDNMALSAWQTRPGIDILMNHYAEDTGAQFGNVRSVREVVSVASQLSRPRTLCEVYGAAGWDLRFVDMKRIADWLFALGVNTIDEHLSYVSIRGVRKTDHPQSFSYHEPWWNEYGVRAEYVARLSAVLSQGNQVQPFCVIEPTTTAWLYQADPSHAGRLAEIGSSFQDFLLGLDRAQVGYDLASEDLIARHGSVLVRRLKIGKRAYRAVVLPPGIETLNAATWKLIDELALTGGTVITCGDPPPLADGRAKTKPAPAGASSTAPPRLPYGWERVSIEQLPAHLAKLASDGFSIRRAQGDRGILFHHRRKLDDGEILFLANTSDAFPTSGVVQSSARGVERWDIETGKAERAVFRPERGGVETPFDLPPCGSLLLFFTWEPRESAPSSRLVSTPIAPVAPPSLERLEANVLALDFADVEAGGTKLEAASVRKASRFAFEAHGFAGNPWESSVQFRDEIIARSLPPSSGVRVVYYFRIDDAVPKRLSIGIERPDLWTIALNGKRLEAEPGKWWLDRSLGLLDAAAAARVGENELVLSASPFTVEHEIEAAWVLGDFALRAADAGFAIVAERPLTLAPWNEQGLPFYGAAVRATQSFVLEVPPEAKGTRHRVRLGAWLGSVARVTVNGKAAGIIEAPPWERDVTSLLVAGENTIAVEVIGTLRNTLGPHHAGPLRGSAWPAAFAKAPERGPPPGRDYSVLGYGLFEPFQLVEVSEERTAGSP